MKIINPKINLDQFFLDLSKSQSAVLILDYDGTLAPFSKDPKKAFPYPGIRERVKEIMQSKQTRVVILSGRSLQELRLLLNIDPPPLLFGSHGAEKLEEGALTSEIKEIDSEVKNYLIEAFNAAKRLAPLLHCEVKPLAVALHWRDQDEKMAKELSTLVLTDWKKNLPTDFLEIHHFDGGMELRLKGIDKGKIVETLMQEARENTLFAYLGDDMTDEDGFLALKDNGIKLLVRKNIRPTNADIQLIPPEELFWFLDRWIEAIKIKELA